LLLYVLGKRVENFALANNGFIWGGSPEVDFTLPGDVAWEYAALSRKGVEPEYVCRTPVMYDESVLAAASHFESKVGITAFSSNPQASLVRRSRANSTEYVLAGTASPSPSLALFPSPSPSPSPSLSPLPSLLPSPSPSA
jgi:hypothetical protein